MLFSRYYTCIFLLGEWCSFDFSPVGAGRAAAALQAVEAMTGDPCDIHCCMDLFIATPIFFDGWLAKYHQFDVSAGYISRFLGSRYRLDGYTYHLSHEFFCCKGEQHTATGWWFGTWLLFFHSVGNVMIPT